MTSWPLNPQLQALKEFEGILGWAKRAGQAKRENPAVINATIGVLKSEGIVACLPTLQKKLIEITARPGTHEYPGLYGIWGEEANKEALLKLALSPKNAELALKLPRFIQSISTIGGTQAIFMAFCLVPQQTILTGWPFWLNYDNIARFAGKNLERFELLIQEGEGYRLNIPALIEASEKIIAQEKSLTLLLNDPSSNPAGLSLTPSDLQDLNRYLQSKTATGTPVTLIIDPAYTAYDPRGVEGSNRETLLNLLQENPEITVFYAWSATKQYLEYNNRSGALIAFQSHDYNLKEYMAGIIRGTISQPPSRTDRALLELVNDGQLEMLNAERAPFVAELKLRADLAVAEAQKLKIPLVTKPDGSHPGGFMAYTPLNNAAEIAEQLTQENIYVVPWEDHGLRIALSGLQMNEIQPLYSTLARYV